MAANPVKYAEETLGVHVPWADVQEHLEAHATETGEAIDLRKLLMQWKHAVEDRKVELRSLAPGAIPGYAEMSATAAKEAVKNWLDSDSDLRAAECQVDIVRNELDTVEASLKHRELALHGLTARMNELAGLLKFYTQAKQAAAAAAERPAQQPVGTATE